jgi:hypothetical protein
MFTLPVTDWQLNIRFVERGGIRPSGRERDPGDPSAGRVTSRQVRTGKSNRLKQRRQPEMRGDLPAEPG